MSEPTDIVETAIHEIPDPDEDPVIDPSVPVSPETPDSDEDDADDHEPPGGSERALVTQRSDMARVQALLAEALRLGQQYGLVERHEGGALVLAGETRRSRRLSSECTCPECPPHDQQHWWCMECGSGPHDWRHGAKPQYERQTLKPGGIQGVRHAVCSAQCARDYLSRLGRQPSGVPMSQEMDPTLGLPG
jgi:hypothetical protein